MKIVQPACCSYSRVKYRYAPKKNFHEIDFNDLSTFEFTQLSYQFNSNDSNMIKIEGRIHPKCTIRWHLVLITMPETSLVNFLHPISSCFISLTIILTKVGKKRCMLCSNKKLLRCNITHSKEFLPPLYHINFDWFSMEWSKKKFFLTKKKLKFFKIANSLKKRKKKFASFPWKSVQIYMVKWMSILYYPCFP